MPGIVVTGASGFLGRAVIAQLRKSGLSVLGVCRSPTAGMHQVADYGDTPRADVIIHLAEAPDRAFVNSSDGSLCRQSDVVRQLSISAGKLVYASSGAVYGDSGGVPFGTDAPAIGYDSYSRLKLANERVVLDAGGAVLRLANLYGAGMSPNSVVSDIVRQIPGAGALRIRDDKPIRDFLAVTDAARAFLLAIGASCDGILNVGSGVGTSIGALARLALQAANQGDREVVVTSPSAKPSINVLDASESQRRLGWSPASSLQDFFSQVFRNEVKVVES